MSRRCDDFEILSLPNNKFMYCYSDIWRKFEEIKEPDFTRLVFKHQPPINNGFFSSFYKKYSNISQPFILSIADRLSNDEFREVMENATRRCYNDGSTRITSRFTRYTKEITITFERDLNLLMSLRYLSNGHENTIRFYNNLFEFEGINRGTPMINLGMPHSAKEIPCPPPNWK